MRRHPPIQPGDKFNRYTVIEFAHKNVRGNGCWLCRCNCGTERVIVDGNLRNGNSKSCGCHNIEALKSRATHGNSRRGAHTGAYSSWQGMLERCINSDNHKYKDYGGRGISVCERWRSFENFLADMGERPEGDYSIERKNVNGNYEPDNCIWATRKVQARNTRRSVFYEFEGEMLCLPDIAERTGKNHSTLRTRLDLGWTLQDAITAPKFAQNPSKKRTRKKKTEW